MKQLRVLHISKSKLCKILLAFKAIQARVVRGTDFTFSLSQFGSSGSHNTIDVPDAFLMFFILVKSQWLVVLYVLVKVLQECTMGNIAQESTAGVHYGKYCTRARSRG